MHNAVYGVCLAIGLVSGCGGGTNDGKTAAAVLELTTKVANLETEINSLKSEQFIANLKGPQEALLFDPQDDKGYQAALAPAGPVLVVLEKLEPYLDGYTVSFRLGNPTSAAYSGVSGKVRWGRLYDATKDAVYNNLVEKDLDLKNDLPAGSWTVVKFNIAPAKPEEVRRIILLPKFDQIQLRRPIG